MQEAIDGNTVTDETKAILFIINVLALYFHKT